MSAGVIINVVHDLPVVGIIKDIYIINENTVAFSVNEWSTSYEPHYRAYILEIEVSLKIVLHSNLFIHNPIFVHKSYVPDLSNVFVLPFALCTCDSN